MDTNNRLPYRNASLPIEERVIDLLGRMTLEEKIAQLSAAWYGELSDENGFSEAKATARLKYGTGEITSLAGRSAFKPAEAVQAANTVQRYLVEQTRLGIPAILHDECLCGMLARQATVFPQIIGAAAAWDAELIEQMATVIRQQMRATGTRQGLAPVLDIARDTRWGRVEETYGEDPYLAARLGTAYVKGLQGDDLRAGVIATGKHFAAHGMAEGGLNWAPVHVGWRELREVFTYPFEAAIQEGGLASILNAYHELDGVPCGSSRELLTDILRGELGFNGMVVADYNAVAMLADYHRVAADKGEAACLALSAGLDVELPGTDCYGAPLLQAARGQKINLAIIDEAVRRVLRLKLRLGLFENPYVDPAAAEGAFNQPEQQALALQVAEKSLVLLKNEGGLLPLQPDLRSIAVIGPNADNRRALLGDYTYGAFAELMAGGENVETKFPGRFPEGMVSILAAIRQRAGTGMKVRYAAGCRVNDGSTQGFAAALQAAHESDLVVMVMGGKSGLTVECTSGELRDRAYLGLPGVQEELVEAILGTGKPVVLVLVDGRPFASPELAERVPAILQAWLPGQAGSPAVANVLFGDANPGGKLPIACPRSASQEPVFYGRKPSGGQSYNFVDYVDLSVKPLYSFGHGLSYTTFEFSHLQISPVQVSADGLVNIQLEVKNTGERMGDEVVQLYLHDPLASVTRPVKELKGFCRVTLQAGEKRRVSFTVAAAQMAFYNLEKQYAVESGKIEVLVGSSSDDIRLRGEFEIVGEAMPVKKKVFFSQAQVL